MKQPLKEKLKAIGGGHLLNEDRGINPKKVEKIEYATYDIEDGYKKLIHWMDNISNAQMKIRPKAIKELKKQQKAFKKIQKLINDTLVG